MGPANASRETFIADLTTDNAPLAARWSGILGVAVLLSTLTAYPIWSFPGTRTPPIEVARWAAAYHDRLIFTMLLSTVGITLLLVFGAAVWKYLRDQLPERSVLPSCFAVGFTGCATLVLSGFTAFDLLLYRRRSADAAALLYDLTFGLLAMAGLPAVVALAAFAVAVYRRRVLPAYTGHLACAAAVAHPLLLVALVFQSGPLSLEGAPIAAMSGLMVAWIFGTAWAMRSR